MTADDLKTVMAERQITIAELAAIVGVSRRSIELYRAGKVRVPEWLSLLMCAIRDGAIKIDWLASYVEARQIA